MIRSRVARQRLPIGYQASELRAQALAATLVLTHAASASG